MDHSIFSTTAWIGLLFSVLSEILLKDKQLITTAFKERVYTDILAYASAPKGPGGFFFFLTDLFFLTNLLLSSIL